MVHALIAAIALAAAPESSVASLHGLSTVRVVVEQMGPEAERTGVRRDALRVDVETALARAGIRTSADADAILYVNVTVACAAATCAFNVAVEAQQKVRLASRPQGPLLIAPTWSGAVTGVAGTRPGVVRRSVREQVGRFVAAWREANPAR